MRKSQLKMPTKAEKLIRNSSLLLLWTVAVSVIQGVWFGLSGSENAFEVIIVFSCIETSILAFLFIPGLKKKQTRFFLLGLTIIEMVLFFLDEPIESNELLLILIFVIRIYVFIKLFSTMSGKFYSIKSSR